MTYIQPNKKTLTTKLLLILVGAIILAAFRLVILYNSTVDLEHGIAGMRKEIKLLQAENVELKEEVFALFDSVNFKKNLGSNLVEDKNPEYMEIGASGEMFDEEKFFVG